MISANVYSSEKILAVFADFSDCGLDNFALPHIKNNWTVFLLA